MTWGPWRHDAGGCCSDGGVELVDNYQTPGAGADEALTVPASPGELVLGPWDTIAPATIAGATEIGERTVISGWFANAGIVSGNDVVSVVLEEFGSSGFAAGYGGAELLAVVEGLSADPKPFTHSVRGRGFRLKLLSNDAANAARIAAHVVARPAGAVMGNQANAADRNQSATYSAGPTSVSAGNSILTPVMMVADRFAQDLMRVPPAAIPNGLLQVPGPLIAWVIEMATVANDGFIEFFGDINPLMANEALFAGYTLKATGIHSSALGLAGTGGAAVQLGDVESPYPFWRAKFTAGGQDADPFTWSVRGSSR